MRTAYPTSILKNNFTVKGLLDLEDQARRFLKEEANNNEASTEEIQVIQEDCAWIQHVLEQRMADKLVKGNRRLVH